jgi:hypothetical protein
MAGIQLLSPSFDHQPIPARHAKDHENLSPALEWSGVPKEAVELAVLCEDPDAPAAPSSTGCWPGSNPPRPGWPKQSTRPRPLRAATTSARKATTASGLRGDTKPSGDVDLAGASAEQRAAWRRPYPRCLRTPGWQLRKLNDADVGRGTTLLAPDAGLQARRQSVLGILKPVPLAGGIGDCAVRLADASYHPK